MKAFLFILCFLATSLASHDADARPKPKSKTTQNVSQIQPRPRPTLFPTGTTQQNFHAASKQRRSLAPQIAQTSQPEKINAELNQALTLAKQGNLTQALQLTKTPLEEALVRWNFVRSPGPHANATHKFEFIATYPDWPDVSRIGAEAEQQLLEQKPDPSKILTLFKSHTPKTNEGRIALIYAHAQTGKIAQAKATLQSLWHTQELSRGTQSWVKSALGHLLTKNDDQKRFEHFLYTNDTTARDVAKGLGAQEANFAKSAAAILNAKKPDLAMLAKIPEKYRDHATAHFLKARILRRQGQFLSASQALSKAISKAPESVVHTTLWREQKILIRELLDIGIPEKAFELASDHRGQNAAEKIEGEFLSGWIALRYLNQPHLALPRFQNIAMFATQPISIARGAYWEGRALDAIGNITFAERAYRRAALWPMTFYGQLAKQRLGHTLLTLNKPDRPTKEDLQSFRKKNLIKALTTLMTTSHENLQTTLFIHLAKSLNNARDLVALGQMAEETGNPRLVLTIGKQAYARGLPMDNYAYPIKGLPLYKTYNGTLEKPIVYAIARQESEFAPQARSHAGASGMMQLMPATARNTAKRYGQPYNHKLLLDPVYNTSIGATHLKELIDSYDGSLILTFAAYNAGGGNVSEWLNTIGDPRSKNIDPIDWIERIPFAETRNYVQRVMENVAVYRARFNHNNAPLTIYEDLRRGSIQ